MAATDTRINIFHIAYSEETYKSAPAGALILDNRSNERPDWREYWPIRRFFSHNTLIEDNYYGFFSPKFEKKTKLNYHYVRDFIEQSNYEFDVYTFSPGADIGSFFLNPFEGNDKFDTEFMSCAQAFVEEVGLKQDLRGIVMDSRQVVFCNYIVARPSFWRIWINICEHLFAIAEGLRPSQLRAAVNAETAYTGRVQRKVFLLERIASLVIATSGLTVKRHNPFSMGFLPVFSEFQMEAIICDALKIAFRELGDIEYMKAYKAVQRRAISDA